VLSGNAVGWVAVPGLLLAIISIGRSDARRILRLLRDGHPALALFENCKWKAPYHHYTYVFVGENGTAYTFRHKVKTRLEAIEDDTREPVLYIPRGETFPDVLLFDGLSTVYLDDRGRIRARSAAVFWALVVFMGVLTGGGLRLFS
jgi:hypothetical protein